MARAGMRPVLGSDMLEDVQLKAVFAVPKIPKSIRRNNLQRNVSLGPGFGLDSSPLASFARDLLEVIGKPNCRVNSIAELTHNPIPAVVEEVSNPDWMVPSMAVTGDALFGNCVR